ncbi:MAG: hypothetical protein OEZ58_22880, partial [Gammaproteobacteria bacterium]|nr:hypothetical protein [Gammaproteobacteria bacterium]
MIWAYLFEAKSIQSYIFESGKLKDVIGGSELVEALVHQHLDTALNSIDEQGKAGLRFVRRAGGAFTLLSDERSDIEDLQSLWSILVPSLAPGLEFIHVMGEGEDDLSAVEDGQKKLQIV